MTYDDRNGMPEEERFDEWLRAAAGDVHAPPPTPREEIWAGIQARRAAADAPPARSLGSGPSRHRLLWPAAVAAALLLGIALDRIVISRSGSPDAASRVAVSPDTGDATGAPARSTAAPDAASHEGSGAVPVRALASGGGSTPRPGSSTSERASRSDAPPQQVAAAEGPRTTRPTSPAGERAPAGVSTMYQLAAVQTLAQAEVLLTTWRTRDREAVDSASMNRLGSWAREVLGSTRLLMDSPAADDPQLRRLLGDLELVLVQLVQLTGGALTEEDQSLIDRALGERDLLPRLRTAVPAGTRTIAS